MAPQLSQSTQTVFEASPPLEEETESEEVPVLPRDFCLSLDPRLRAPWLPLSATHWVCLWPSSMCNSAMNELHLPSGYLIRGTSVAVPCLLAPLCSSQPSTAPGMWQTCDCYLLNEPRASAANAPESTSLGMRWT